MTHEVTKEIQEFNEVSQHPRLFSTSLLSLQGHIIPPEASRFVYTLKCRVRC